MTAQYTYDAMNRRVQTNVGGTLTEFVYNANGQRVSEWNGSTNTEIRGHYYWGAKPVAFYAGGQTYFQHQDWVGTERGLTAYDGSGAGGFTSLPFGDAQTTINGSDLDPYHFAMLDSDSETGTEHATFRQYSETQGRWMSPDPYPGSYDPYNPQSFNRYAYALNDPLSLVDPSGLDHCSISSLNGPAPIYNDYGETVNTNDPASCWAAGGQWMVDTTVVVYGGDPNSCDPSTDSYCQSLLYFEGGGGQVGTSGGGGGSGGSAPNRGPSYTRADVCAASALLNKGGSAALDAIGIIPAIGNLGKGIKVGIQIAQHAAAIASLALTVFGPANTADAVFTGTGTGLTAIDDAKVMTEGAELVPVIGNGVSVFATTRDIWGKEGMVNYYNDCMAGKN